MNTLTAQDNTAGYWELVRDNRNFRYLWLGQIVSLLGDWFNLIASASLIALLTQSGFAVGSLFVVRMLAPFLVSPIAGVVADRYNRKQVLIITDIIRAVAVLGFLFVRDPGHVWLLYTLTAVQLGISGFFFPTRNAILPDLTSAHELGAANALSSATWSVMLALGAAIGGVVSGIWGIYPAFVIDGVTFVLSAVLIAQIRLDVAPGLDVSDKTVGAALKQYAEGLRYLGRHIDILIVTCHKAAVSLLMFGGFQVAQVVVAEQVFPIGEGGGISMGLLFGVTGVGTGLGPILARYFTGDRNRPLGLAIILGYFIGALGLAITAPLANFSAVLLGSAVRGAGGGIVWVFSTQLLLQQVSQEVRGRIFATEFAMFTLTSAIGAALAGSGLDLLSISGIIWVMAGAIMLPGFLWAIWLGRTRSGASPEAAEATKVG